MGKKIAIVVAILLAVPVVTALGQKFIQRRVDAKITESIEQARKELPKVIGDAIRLDNISYANRTVHYDAVVLANANIDDSRKAAFQTALKEKYCQGNMQLYAKAGVSVEYAITFESVFYKTIEWDFKAVPADCPRS